MPTGSVDSLWATDRDQSRRQASEMQRAVVVVVVVQPRNGGLFDGNRFWDAFKGNQKEHQTMFGGFQKTTTTPIGTRKS